MGSQVRDASRSRLVRNASSCALSTTTANLIAVGKQVDLHLAEQSSIPEPGRKHCRRGLLAVILLNYLH
jgi:hypothetical protein